MYGLNKIDKDIIEKCSNFLLILSAVNTPPTYKWAKFLVPILKSLPSNEFTVKDSFTLADEIFEQDFEFFMESLNADSFLTNILLGDTIDICTKNFICKYWKSRRFIKNRI